MRIWCAAQHAAGSQAPQSAPVKSCPQQPCLSIALLAALVGGPALAQTAAAPAPAASAPTQRIEITGGRESETEQRRRATAAKIVIGREEIEQYGDSTVGEVLRRLPGVSTPGGPGRGGAPRLRGLGGGYTQLLIDGERIPRGFSLESLTPDQVERIEILRAPTAETGARAIAGTINIVLREGYRRRLNDLRLGAGIESGELSPGAFWTWNDTVRDVATNLSGGLSRRSSVDRSRVESDTVGGDEPGQNIEQRESVSRRLGLNLAARLQWRLGADGDSLLLSPSLFHADNRSRSSAQLQTLSGAPRYETALGESEGSFSNLRLNGQWRQRLGPGRIESSLTGGSWRAESRSQRQEFAGGGLLRTRDEDNDLRQDSLRLSGKYSVLLGGDERRENSEHSGVGGAELELDRRSEARSLLQDGQPLLTEFGDNLSANSLRLALYAQDEWTPTPNWALHFGLRWEGIRTVGDPGDGSHPTHLDRVLTPLAHAVWKPDPASRSQVRLSLTRSWRAPGLGNLIARPRPNERYPLEGENVPTAARPRRQPRAAARAGHRHRPCFRTLPGRRRGVQRQPLPPPHPRPDAHRGGAGDPCPGARCRAGWRAPATSARPAPRAWSWRPRAGWTNGSRRPGPTLRAPSFAPASRCSARACTPCPAPTTGSSSSPTRP